jgi:hypothetical protein
LVGIALIVHDSTHHENDSDVIEMPEALARFFESLVGVFMLCLGFYGFRRALRKKHELDEARLAISGGEVNTDEAAEKACGDDPHCNRGSHVHAADGMVVVELLPGGHVDRDDAASMQVLENRLGSDDAPAYGRNDKAVAELPDDGHLDSDDTMPMQILEKGLGSDDEPVLGDDPHHNRESPVPPATNAMAVAELPGHSSSIDLEAANSVGSDKPSSCLGRFVDSCRQMSVQMIAVLAGILHGFAGPGAILAVVPAVQLHNWKLATLFLTCFCVTSTLTMGCFGCVYGSFTRGVGRRAHLEYQIHLFSASLSVLVGILWLVLIATGKMDDVFH